MTIIYQGIHQFLDWFMGVTVFLIIFYIIRLLFSLIGHTPEDKSQKKGFDDLKGIFKSKAEDSADEKQHVKKEKAVDKHVDNLNEALASVNRASRTPTSDEAGDFVEKAKHFLNKVRDSNDLENLAAGTPYEEESKLIRAESVKLLEEMNNMEHSPESLRNLNARLGAIQQSIHHLKRAVTMHRKKTRKAKSAKLKGVVERK